MVTKMKCFTRMKSAKAETYKNHRVTHYGKITLRMIIYSFCY